jgi:transglutaminase-like putative cysteine protease
MTRRILALPGRFGWRSPRSQAALLQWLAMGLLGLGLARLVPGELISGLVIGLALLTLLKLREARSLAERRLVALLQLVCTGLLAALQPELGPSLLQAATAVVALAGLLALELGEGLDGRMLLRRSLQVLAATLPLALLLFVLAPRLEPFSVLPWQRGAAAATGLSDTLEPGAIEQLARDRAPAARLAFPRGGGPPAPSQRYWRVLVHSVFDGRRWTSAARSGAAILNSLDLQQNLPPAGASAAGALGTTPTQLWLTEPSPLVAVPWSGGGRPLGPELVPRPDGELWHRGPMSQRRVYALSLNAAEADWRRQPPTGQELLLPWGSNPRLEALGRSWQALPPEQRLAAAERWFRDGGFRYTLTPGRLPAVAPLDAFLFERRSGFCGHYASAYAALLRAAGLPARVVSGYRGGSWVVPFNGEGYLDLRQADAHAWSEVWLTGQGWQGVDPTAWIEAAPNSDAAPAALRAGPLLWLQRQWWGLDIAWARWWLGYDRQQQDLLLQRLLGPWRDWLGLLLLLLLAACLGLALAWLGWLQHHSGRDRLERTLRPLLLQLERQGLTPRPGETLTAFAGRVGSCWPPLRSELEELIGLVQAIRYAPSPPPQVWRHLGRRRRRLSRQLKRQAALGRPAATEVQRSATANRS